MQTSLAEKEDGLKKRHDDLEVCAAELEIHAHRLVTKVRFEDRRFGAGVYSPTK